MSGSLVMLAGAVVSAVCNGVVFSMMWGWYVVSMFKLPHLSIPGAIGIALMVQFLVNSPRVSLGGDYRIDVWKAASLFVSAVLYATLYLVVGGLFALFR